MIALRIKRFTLTRASTQDTRWLTGVLDREGRKFGTGVRIDRENRLTLHWA